MYVNIKDEEIIVEVDKSFFDYVEDFCDVTGTDIIEYFKLFICSRIKNKPISIEIKEGVKND